MHNSTPEKGTWFSLSVDFPLCRQHSETWFENLKSYLYLCLWYNIGYFYFRFWFAIPNFSWLLYENDTGLLPVVMATSQSIVSDLEIAFLSIKTCNEGYFHFQFLVGNMHFIYMLMVFTVGVGRCSIV